MTSTDLVSRAAAARRVCSAPVAGNPDITLRGSWVNLYGRDIFVAGELESGNQTIMLRNRDGTPAWEGSRTYENPRR
ncbi:MAG TPA: hypothetical protein VGM03_05445 [Phycisphaerae bacterium]|jgi:hypothetical protein